jgi:hypothetical protein
MKSICQAAMIISGRSGHDTQRAGLAEVRELVLCQPGADDD